MRRLGVKYQDYFFTDLRLVPPIFLTVPLTLAFFMHFERHIALQLGVCSPIDLTHTTLANPRGYGVVRNRSVDQWNSVKRDWDSLNASGQYLQMQLERIESEGPYMSWGVQTRWTGVGPCLPGLPFPFQRATMEVRHACPRFWELMRKWLLWCRWRRCRRRQ